MKTICFTGHRRLSQKQYDWLAETLPSVIERAIDRGFTRFISGGALGFDQLAAETIVWLKDSYNIELWLAEPFLDFSSKWDASQKKLYNLTKGKANKVCTLEWSYFDGVYQERNEWMVDESSVVIAAWNGNPSGTKNTVDYAVTKNKRVLHLDLNTFNENWK